MGFEAEVLSVIRDALFLSSPLISGLVLYQVNKMDRRRGEEKAERKEDMDRLSRLMCSKIGEVKEEISDVREDLKTKVRESVCGERREACTKLLTKNQCQAHEAIGELWTAFNHHSHEGLAPGSKVTRG